MSEVDATHYSFYVDESDESIVINEEKLKASGLPYIRRYRTKSCNSSAASSATPETNRLNDYVDDSLLGTELSAHGSGSSADDCIDGFNKLRLSNVDCDKENREPSKPERVSRAFNEKCGQIASQSESTDACAEPEEDILAPYFKLQQCETVTGQEATEEKSKQRASEAQLRHENSSIVMTEPLAMSTPRPSKASAQNVLYRCSETAEAVAPQKPSTEIQEISCNEDPVRQRLSFGSSHKAEHTFDNELLCSGLKPFPTSSHTETEQEPVPHNPPEIRTCDKSFIVIEKPTQEKFQAAAAATSPHSNDELQSAAVTTVSHFIEQAAKTLDCEPTQEKFQAAAAATSPHSNDELQSAAVTTVSHFIEQAPKTLDCEPTQEKFQAAAAATSPHSNDELQSAAVSHFIEQAPKTSDCVPEQSKQDCPTVESGVEMACQTSFCIGNVPATSTACVTPVKHFAVRKSLQKGAGSAPAKPFLNRRESNVAGTVRGRCRTPSNIPFRKWNSPTSSPKRRDSVFKVPTPIRGKTPGGVSAGETPQKSAVKSPLSAGQVQARDGTPRSVKKGARSPWSVVSPVARYIHENPAPPLIQIVRPRKSPSAKTLTTATSPVHSPTLSASPRTAPLPDKRYQTSNMGILHRVGLDHMAKPSKPIVIKHTVSRKDDGRSVPEMEASVIHVIRH